MRIIEQIRRCDKIKNSVKFDAIEDIEEMANSKLYGERVEFDKDQNNLIDAFIWQKSYLGFDFWKVIWDFIDNENEQFLTNTFI